MRTGARGSLPPSQLPAAPGSGQGVKEGARQEQNALVHVEGQGDVLILGEEQDKEVVAGLALLYRGVQADLKREEGARS